MLVYLKGCLGPDASEQDNAAITRHPRDDIDVTLRALGYNRREREQLRRGKPRSRNNAGYHDTTRKRFKYYIAQQLPDLTDTALDRLATMWTTLTSYDLDLAQRWWASGIDPGNPAQLADAIKAGLQVEHLKIMVQGRTIAEHLRAGNSVRWCMGAIGLTTAIGSTPDP